MGSLRDGCSIIIVVKNNLSGFKKTLDSIERFWGIEQNYFKLIIVDGYSRDGTWGEVQKRKTKLGSNILAIQQTPQGIYEAMNFAISLAENEWLWMINSGDIVTCSLNEVKKELIGSKKFDAVAFKCGFFYRENPNIFFYRSLEEGRSHQSFVYKKSAHESFGLYDSSYRIISDTIFLRNFRNDSIEYKKNIVSATLVSVQNKSRDGNVLLADLKLNAFKNSLDLKKITLNAQVYKVEAIIGFPITNFIRNLYLFLVGKVAIKKI